MAFHRRNILNIPASQAAGAVFSPSQANKIDGPQPISSLCLSMSDVRLAGQLSARIEISRPNAAPVVLVPDIPLRILAVEYGLLTGCNPDWPEVIRANSLVGFPARFTMLLPVNTLLRDGESLLVQFRVLAGGSGAYTMDMSIENDGLGDEDGPMVWGIREAAELSEVNLPPTVLCGLYRAGATYASNGGNLLSAGTEILAKIKEQGGNAAEADYEGQACWAAMAAQGWTEGLAPPDIVSLWNKLLPGQAGTEGLELARTVRKTGSAAASWSLYYATLLDDPLRAANNGLDLAARTAARLLALKANPAHNNLRKVASFAGLIPGSEDQENKVRLRTMGKAKLEAK